MIEVSGYFFEWCMADIVSRSWLCLGLMRIFWIWEEASASVFAVSRSGTLPSVEVPTISTHGHHARINK